MRRMILVVLGLLLTAPLWADVTKTVTWTAPTQRVNGDALSAQEIAGYVLECRRLSGEVVYAQQLLPPAPRTHVTPEVFDSGDFQCFMRTVDTDSRLSAWGESNVFTVGRCDATDCSPMPPTSITVTFPQ